MAIQALVRWFEVHRSPSVAVAASLIMTTGFGVRALGYLVSDGLRGRGLDRTRANLRAATVAGRAPRSSS